MPNNTADRALLTLSDVWRMEEESRRLKSERDILDAKIRNLENRLAAAKYFMGDEVITSTGTPSVSVSTQPKSEVDNREPLPDAILRTIREAGQPLTNIEIRRTLEREPVHAERFESSPNYFYTAMRRLRNRDFLIKVGNKFDLSPEEKGNAA
ncbi:MAG: hypothetical protein CMF63_09350 [Magnetovibrio sp.]|nr:hypothetical protein [Magnetovibrio sp.]